MLNKVTFTEGLRDGRGEPGEDFVVGFVPDLKRTARTKDDRCWLRDDSPQREYDRWCLTEGSLYIFLNVLNVAALIKDIFAG